MNIRFVFDFHDVVVDAKSAWEQAFGTVENCDSIINLYRTGVSKREICNTYNLNYNQIEEVYRANLRTIDENLTFIKKLALVAEVEIVSCSNAERLMKDIRKFDLEHLFSKIAVCKKVQLHDYLLRESKECERLIYFNHVIPGIKTYERLTYVPINFAGDLESISQKSFTEHARSKLLYNELSKHYMDSIANDTQQEIDFLFNIMPQSCTSILDCCCGVGRHAIELAKRGKDIYAFDYSTSQIQTAKMQHSHEKITYAIMDARKINIQDKLFDMAICMWTTYNYLSLDEDFVAFLNGVSAHLRTGGYLVLDSKNIPSLEKYRVYKRSRVNGNFKLDLYVCKRIIGNVQNSQYFYFVDDNGDFSFCVDEEFVRFYSLEEIIQLADTHFAIRGVFGNFLSEEYDPHNSERFIVVLEKK